MTSKQFVYVSLSCIRMALYAWVALWLHRTETFSSLLIIVGACVCALMIWLELRFSIKKWKEHAR